MSLYNGKEETWDFQIYPSPEAEAYSLINIVNGCRSFSLHHELSVDTLLMAYHVRVVWYHFCPRSTYRMDEHVHVRTHACSSVSMKNAGEGCVQPSYAWRSRWASSQVQEHNAWLSNEFFVEGKCISPVVLQLQIVPRRPKSGFTLGQLKANFTRDEVVEMYVRDGQKAEMARDWVVQSSEQQKTPTFNGFLLCRGPTHDE